MGHARDPSCDTLLVLGLPFYGDDNPPSAGRFRGILPKQTCQLQTPTPPTEIPSKHLRPHHLEAPIDLFDEPSLTLGLSYNVVSHDEEDRGHPLAHRLEYGALCPSPTSTSTFSNSCHSSGGGGVKRHRTDADGASDRKSKAEAENEVDKAVEYDLDDGTASARRKKKLRKSKEQIAVLQETFDRQATLSKHQKTDLAIKARLETRQVEVWFQNRRARNKQKQIELECAALREHCKKLDDENRRLKNELRELHSAITTATQPAHPTMYTLTTTTVCPTCYKISTTATNAINNAASFAVPPKSAQQVM